MIKVLKWLFLTIWILCISAFLIGQYNAPPEYHLQPGNPWGQLFGTTVVAGIISICLAVLFFGFDSGKSKQEKNQHLKFKYNISLKRLISRVLLTILVGIFFGIAMLPFLTVADVLLYEQRSSIGGQNLIRGVALWGIYTLIVTLFTLWKKHFRMVSVFLVICWIIGVGIVLSISTFDANSYRCMRASPYIIPSEFNRSLDLIAQRMGVDKTAAGTVWQTAFNFRNCLDIQYSETDNNNVEAYFLYPIENSQEHLQDLKILVDPSYSVFDDLTLALLLSHEIVHSAQYINQVLNNTQFSCYEKEAKAFTAQHAFILSLNQEEQRSINARLHDDAYKNPTIATILLTSERGNEATQACIDLQQKNNLTNEQLNECSWQGLENKLLQDIMKEPYYQTQCGNSNEPLQE
jgi:hypothetical protein